MLFFLGKHLADKLSLPSVRLFSTFALNKEILNSIIYTDGPPMGLFKSKLLRKWITAMLLGNIIISNKDLLDELTDNMPALNFIFTSREFQVCNEKFPDKQFKFIGPSLGSRMKDNKINIESIEKPLIYIALGSILNNSMSFYKRCIEAFKNENVSVIMSVGNKVPIEKLRNMAPNFKIYPYVPQLQILEKVNLFITHGSINSINEALYFGVPLLVLPLATDQQVIAERIVTLNLGSKFINKCPSAKEIRRNSIEILESKTILLRTKQFQSHMKQTKGTAYAVSEITKYVHQKQFKKVQNQEKI